MAALTDAAALDAYMLNASYVEGHTPTQKDVSLYNAISKPAASFPHALRWYSHIGSFSAAKLASLPGTPETIAPAPAPTPAPKPAPAPAPAPAPTPESKKEKKEKKKAEKPKEEEKKEDPAEKAAKEAEKAAKDAAKEKEKLLKKVIKEGGKKGVEIEGASDMGGLEFFCTTIESPDGDLGLLQIAMTGEGASDMGGLEFFCTTIESPDGDLGLLQIAMTAMNAQPEEGAEDRKGCSGHVGKMIFSAGVQQLGIVAYVPADKLEKVDIMEWTAAVVAAVNGKVTKEATDADSPMGGKVVEAVVEADPDAGKFPLKDKDAAMAAAF
eukprot:CAMPEP_0119403862 /NCGR_PEP_ID=MMETSP1334-20130426/143602_1 /TAXON_ID=127549 /ORGANISM="Calcidiscus leptoporus, Strain RCC1130" /LENGTH=324 /DNA_ID=CAMNT_0007427813 /DNA_START=26 /DNA_END=998 /DNA_ORIENTATION=+